MSMKFARASGLGVLFGLACGLATPAAHALTWKGHTWNVTSGGMAGVCQGNPNNVSVDSNGYLHLQITNNGGTWTAAELFTSDELGVGTYQWHVDGAIDQFAPWIVLGLFPYGPAAGIGADGTDEIDIEYSVWGHAGGPNGDWTDYPASGTTIGELAYTFDLGGSTLSTSRFVWGKTSIESFLIGGIAAIDTTAGLIKSWTYSPPNPTVNIPQQALPLGMNLWCFQAPPAGAQNVEIVIRDFQMVPEGAGSNDGDADGGGEGGSDAGEGGSGASGAASGSGSGSGDSGAGNSGDTAGSGTAGGSGSVVAVGSAGNSAPSSGAGSPSGSTSGDNSATASGGLHGSGRASGGNAGSGAMSSGNAVMPHETPAPASGCSCSTVGNRPADSSFTALWIASALAALALRATRARSG